LPTSSERLRRR